jgi:tRNA G10  N-methylase Trm11
VLARRAQWRHADPAELELWALEAPAGRFRLGLRLTTGELRHRGGRATERPGALRPTVAAAMVRLAEEPGGLLYDPCCGSGSILDEARAAGWRVAGSDVDPEAVSAARSNLGAGADVFELDARALRVPNASVAAVVSNLPFGKRFELPGDQADWFERLFAEVHRITEPGAPVVLLMPANRSFERALEAAAFERVRRVEIELLGTPTAVRVLRRDSD